MPVRQNRDTQIYFVRWIVKGPFGAKAQSSPLQSQNFFRTKPEKMSVGYIEGKTFFSRPLFFSWKLSVVKWKATNFASKPPFKQSFSKLKGEPPWSLITTAPAWPLFLQSCWKCGRETSFDHNGIFHVWVFRHRLFRQWTSWRSGTYHNRVSGRRFPWRSPGLKFIP